MKRVVAVLIVGCAFLDACGATSTAQSNAPAAITSATAAGLGQTTTAQPIKTQPANLPTSRPAPTASAPAEEPTMDANHTPSENPAPTAPVERGATAPLDPALARLVAGARADLAKRRGVARDAIEVVEVRSVTWPDPSLGCPQPGMAYKQVPVDGVLIRLRIDGRIFNYHGGGGRAPFLCEQPADGSVPLPRFDH
jgi:hypothetical protein